MRIRLFICALGLLCPAIGITAEAMEQVEVLGAKQRTTVADINLETYNGFEQITTRADFEDRFVDVSDLVNQSLSAQTRKNAGTGSYSAASIRGSTGKQINLYLDGMLLTSPSSGYSKLATIPVSIIEQLEIYPDFTPAELGNANLGGAINIRTRLPRQGTGGRVAASTGSFNTRQQELALWHGGNKTDAMLALNHNRSDNDYPIDRDVICEFMTCGDSDKRENAAYSQYSGIGKLRRQLNRQYALQLMLAANRSDNEVPIANNRTSHDAELDNRLYQFHLLLESASDAADWGTRLYGHRQKEHFIDRTGTLITGGGSDIEQELDTLGANIYSHWRLGNHQPGLTLDISESESSTDDLRHDQQFSATRESINLALSEHWQATNALALNAIMRSQWINDQTSEDLNNPYGSRCDGDDNECTRISERHDSWQAGIAWQHGGLTLKSNIGRMVRPPTLTERFGETGAFLGNPDLKAETSRNIDAGILFDSRRHGARLVAFHKQLQDGIFVRYDSRGVGHPDNIARATISGVEAFYRFHTGAWQLFIGGQWMDSNNDSEIKADKDKYLHGFYHYSNQLGVSWRTGDHHTQLSYHYDDKLYYTSSNSVEAPARKLLNAGYTWRPGDFSLNLRIDNLLDYRYLDFNFMPAQGRSYTVTTSYTF